MLSIGGEGAGGQNSNKAIVNWNDIACGCQWTPVNASTTSVANTRWLTAGDVWRTVSNTAVCIIVVVSDPGVRHHLGTHTPTCTTWKHQTMLAHTRQLAVPRTNTSYGDRSFAVSRPSMWNSLPAAVRSSDCAVTTFRTQLKTLLFVWLSDCVEDSALVALRRFCAIQMAVIIIIIIIIMCIALHCISHDTETADCFHSTQITLLENRLHSQSADVWLPT